jgi:hypothetical protein
MKAIHDAQEKSRTASSKIISGRCPICKATEKDLIAHIKSHELKHLSVTQREEILKVIERGIQALENTN